AERFNPSHRRTVCAPGAAASSHRGPLSRKDTSMTWFTPWLRKRMANGRLMPRRSQCPDARIHPSLESLDERWLPSTLTVTNSLDDGSFGSLRYEIAAASPDDRIAFAKSVHSITLNGSELVVDKDLEIDGPGVTELTISGNNASRVFDISGS